MKKSLIVDCGATKTDWYSSDGVQMRTTGFNLAQTPAPQLQAILDDAASKQGEGIEEVHFYAAGLVGESPVDLNRWFPGASIEYASDMLGAARAVCRHRPGIAAILGTGANTCQYDGKQITRKVNCGGFIVGDEGSAAVLGRIFITDFLKGLVPEEMSQAFTRQFPSDYPTIVKNIYSGDAPARYLGSFAPFILSYYRKQEYATKLIEDNFCRLFERSIKQYDSLPVGVVGSFGFAAKDILLAVGARYGVRYTLFLPTPIEGLKKYHGL